MSYRSLLYNCAKWACLKDAEVTGGFHPCNDVCFWHESAKESSYRKVGAIENRVASLIGFWTSGLDRSGQWVVTGVPTAS